MENTPKGRLIRELPGVQRWEILMSSGEIVAAHLSATMRLNSSQATFNSGDVVIIDVPEPGGEARIIGVPDGAGPVSR